MVKNSVLLLLHPSKWHVEEQGRFKTKKYYHRVIGPVWLLAATGTLTDDHDDPEANQPG